jgi:PPOX class probable F420-dependent enzyme
MSVRLSRDQAWDVLEHAHTGILTTLRRDGSPVTLPVWFVVRDRTVCFMTYEPTRKVARITNDPRASFLVESGERWADLRAVHLSGRIEHIDDEGEAAAVDAALDAKYAAYRTPEEEMPESAKRTYSVRQLFFRLVPDDRILSWDNALLRPPVSS